MLGNYLIARKDQTLPAIDPENFYEYILAGNGVFVRAARDEFEAMVQVANCTVKGLAYLRSYIAMKHGKLPLACTWPICDAFRRAYPNEALVWVTMHEGLYKVIMPPQVAGPDSVRPVDPHDPAGVNAFMDIHSHGAYLPGFSPTDDDDELAHRLKIFATIGRVADQPEIVLRVVVNSHVGYFPAADVMELPDNVKDVHPSLRSVVVELSHGDDNDID